MAKKTVEIPEWMVWIIERLSESSTWRGLFLLATGAGIYVEPEMEDAIIAFGLSAAGLINVARKEK